MTGSLMLSRTPMLTAFSLVSSLDLASSSAAAAQCHRSGFVCFTCYVIKINLKKSTSLSVAARDLGCVCVLPLFDFSTPFLVSAASAG